MENFLRFGLALRGAIEPPPIFLVLVIKLPDGPLLVRVEVEFLHGHLKIDALAGNAGKCSEECQTRTGFLKSMSRGSGLAALAIVLVLAVGLACCAVEGRTSQGLFTI